MSKFPDTLFVELIEDEDVGTIPVAGMDDVGLLAPYGMYRLVTVMTSTHSGDAAEAELLAAVEESEGLSQATLDDAIEIMDQQKEKDARDHNETPEVSGETDTQAS
jgi:hypothetical protein